MTTSQAQRTSAGSAFGVVRASVLAGFGFVAPTSAAPIEARDPRLHAESTSAGVSIGRAEGLIAELRRVSGLTWEQLATLFGVARRSLHLWASGRPMSGPNEERLHRLVAVLRRIDRGAADWNRRELLRIREDQVRLFDLLAQGDYEAVLGSLEQTAMPVRRASPQVDQETRRQRTPAPPDRLVDAIQEGARIEIKKHPRFKAVRIRRKR